MPRPKAPRCKRQRCTKRVWYDGLCKSHALKRADDKFSRLIRGLGLVEWVGCYGRTEFWKGPEFECAGSMQCCHLFSRRYRNTRWHTENAVPMCAAHHKWFDENPIEREDMIKAWLGDKYEPLRRKALQHGDWRQTLMDYLNPSGAAEDNNNE